MLSAIVELSSELADAPVLLAVPGMKIGVGGWHVGAGVRLPAAGEPPFDYQLLFQVGYHVEWSRTFAGG